MEIISNIIGIIGVSLVILSYLLLQVKKITSDSLFYLNSNLFGSIMLLCSLYYHWNLASVVIEIIWILISLYGLVKYKMNNKII